jgi:hypothetical protein
MPQEVSIQADPRLRFDEVNRSADGGRRYRLQIDAPEPRYIVARVGPDGPILTAARADGFRLFAGGDTHLRVAEQHADGSRVDETVLLVSPVLPQLSVRMDIIVGGITFEDGTVTTILTADDFNSLGEILVRVLRPADALTSDCNTVKAYQGTELIGIR